jgi:DNA polymerase
VRRSSPPVDLDPEVKDALGLLARGLVGVVDVAALDDLPWGPALAAAVRAAGATAARTSSVSTTATAPAASATPATPAAPPSVHGAEVKAEVVVPIAAAGLAVVGPAASTTVVHEQSTDRAERLRVLRDEVIGACTRCKLHRGRNKIVFGEGATHAPVVFVGEGPGADEDREGVPFVGAAGRLLTRMIEAMGLTRDAVYICNVVKCRPPNNRDPEPDEVAACEGFLQQQLAIVRPRVIVGLGRHACQTLLRTPTPISKLRGRWHSYDGIDLMPTFHPSYLLREERDPTRARKREAWSDLQLVMERLGLPHAPRG